MKKIFLLVILSVFCSSIAHAGRLTLIGIPKIDLREADGALTISGTYSIENHGDELAKEVFPSFELGEWQWAGEPRMVERSGKAEWSFSAEIPKRQFQTDQSAQCAAGGRCAGISLPDRGLYPLRVRRNYSDLNGYKFSAADVVLLPVGELTPEEQSALRLPEIELRATVNGDGENFELAVEVDNRGSSVKRVELSAFGSRELRIESPPQELELQPQQISRANLKVRNFTGLPGSVYATQVVASWEARGLRAAAVTSGFLHVEKVDRSRRFLLGAGILTILLGAALYFGFYSRSRAK